MRSESKRRRIWTAVFAVGMGWLEAAVVVYLRLLYSPEGFEYPLRTMPGDVLRLEALREAATIVMLIAVGWLAGRGKLERFGYFMMAFGIWDIVYYIGLRAAVGWPESLMTMDLLFL